LIDKKIGMWNYVNSLPPSAVKCHNQNDQAFSEIRGPLETALETSLEEYIQAVNERLPSNVVDDEKLVMARPFCKADQELASIIKSSWGTGPFLVPSSFRRTTRIYNIL
jgi:hypothetical protein